jgi:hypothetical protein
MDLSEHEKKGKIKYIYIVLLRKSLESRKVIQAFFSLTFLNATKKKVW